MTFFFLVFLLAAVIIYIFWILIKPGEEHAPKKEARKEIDQKNKPTKNKFKTTEMKPEDQTSNTNPFRIKIAEQMKKDPEIISRAISYWLNQKE